MKKLFRVKCWFGTKSPKKLLSKPYKDHLIRFQDCNHKSRGAGTKVRKKNHHKSPAKASFFSKVRRRKKRMSCCWKKLFPYSLYYTERRVSRYIRTAYTEGSTDVWAVIHPLQEEQQGGETREAKFSRENCQFLFYTHFYIFYFYIF